MTAVLDSPAPPAARPREEAHQSRNFRALAGDSASFAVGLSFFEMATVLPVFIVNFTDSPLLIGSVVALKNAGYYLPQLPFALGLRRLKHVKTAVLVLALIGRLALVGTVPLTLLSPGLDRALVLWLFLGGYALFSFTEGGASLAWLDLVGKAVVPRVRGRLFGVAQAVGGVASLFAAACVQAVLGGDRLAFPFNFAVLFALGCAAFAVSFVCIALVHEPRSEDDGDERVPTRTAVRDLVLDGRVQRVVLAQVLAGSLNLALPFYVIFGEGRLQLSPDWIAWFMLAQTVGTAGMGLVWGRVAERSGAQRVLQLAAGLLVAAPLLALLADVTPLLGPLALVATFAFAGAGYGGTRLAFMTYGLDLSRPDNRRQYFGVVNTANAPILLMPLLGGVLLESGSFELLFVATALAGALALASSLGLPDLRAPREP